MLLLQVRNGSLLPLRRRPQLVLELSPQTTHGRKGGRRGTSTRKQASSWGKTNPRAQTAHAGAPTFCWSCAISPRSPSSVFVAAASCASHRDFSLVTSRALSSSLREEGPE